MLVWKSDNSGADNQGTTPVCVIFRLQIHELGNMEHFRCCCDNVFNFGSYVADIGVKYIGSKGLQAVAHTKAGKKLADPEQIDTNYWTIAWKFGSPVLRAFHSAVHFCRYRHATLSRWLPRSFQQWRRSEWYNADQLAKMALYWFSTCFLDRFSDTMWRVDRKYVWVYEGLKSRSVHSDFYHRFRHWQLGYFELVSRPTSQLL